MAGMLLVLAVGVLFSPLPELKPSEANAAPVRRVRQAGERTSIFQFPHLWLGVLCLFVYVGVEVMAGDAIGTYGHGFDCRWTRPSCSPRSRWARCWPATWSAWC
jgi:fucose permease